MERSRRVIGIAMIIICLLAIFSWEKWGRSRFIYDDALALKADVDRGTVITRDMIRIIKSDDVVKGVLVPEDLEWLVGKEAGHVIHENTVLYKDYFNPKGMTLGDDRKLTVLSFSEAWLESMPRSLKRSDTALVYSGENRVCSVRVLEVAENQKSFEAVVTSKQAAMISGLASKGKRFTITYS